MRDRALYIRHIVRAVFVAAAIYLARNVNAAPIKSIVILAEDPATQRVAEVLKHRIEVRSKIQCTIAAKFEGNPDYWIALGQMGAKGLVSREAFAHALSLVGKTRPLPEGYAIKSVKFSQGEGLIAIGADQRGVLYAAGEVLRQAQFAADQITIGQIDLRTAPAYRFRGSSANQGGTMMKATGARAWTADELHEVILDYALAGANCFYTEDQPGPLYDFVKSFGLMTTSGARPNQLNSEFPPEWKAGGREFWEGKNWVCPSIPDARKALLNQWTADFAKRADHDVMRFYAGDPGGCTDARCTPWGNTFVHLSEEMANIWLKDHPKSIVLIANQGMDSAGDQCIFDYFNAAPRPWCYGLCYGPGSNAMSDYFRDHLRDDLFEYPGDGPVNRYLSETLRQLPADKRIVHYSDITHWISAQYAVANPDPYMIRAYGRRTFHARPAAMYRIFHAIMPFSEGDIIYSEGYHDELHQYIWNRMLWNPNRTLDDLLTEYCTYHFGAEAATLMVQAIRQVESELDTPVATNDGISRYYDLVKQAGTRIPANLMAVDHRWRMHMQHAALTRHLQLRLNVQLDQEAKVREILAAGLQHGKLDDAISAAISVFDAQQPTPEMESLKEEVRKLGEETNTLFGIRDIGFFRMERTLRDIASHKTLLEKALAAKSRGEKRSLVQQCIDEIDKPTQAGNFFA